MNNHNMDLLFNYARDHQFSEFDTLFCEMEAKMPPDTFWEAYLMRAQIKLYATDLTILDDLEKAEQGSGEPQFPPLITSWKSDGANHFIVFPKALGALQAFLSALPLVQKKLSRWYGSQSDVVLLQLQGEIHYFMGAVELALSFVEAQRSLEPKTPIDAMLALILEYKCYLALAESDKAHECMFAGIRQSKAYPECVEMYAEFRRWANLTTGWCGDSLRVYEDEKGEKHPVLEDRVESIKNGIARDTPLESPFVEYAKCSYDGAYTLRQYYMELFHAMYWFSVNDHKQAETYFHNVYEIAAASDVFMPMIECGEQAMPILKHMKNSDCELPLDELIRRNAEYEESVNAYRLADM